MAIQTLATRPTAAPSTLPSFRAQSPEALIAQALKDTYVATPVRPSPTAPRTYTVAKGDAIEAIARRTGVSVATLERLNPEIFKDGKDARGRRRASDGWWIYPGDVLKLSTGSVVTPPKPKPPVTPKPPAPSPEAIALTRARQTIDGATIPMPPTDFSRILTWIDRSSRTLEQAQAALVTLDQAARKGTLPVTTFSRYQQKVDALFETYATYMTGITAGSRTYGPTFED